MKYIDAKRLRARIEKDLTFDNSIDTAYYIGRRDAERNILSLIDSLPDEPVSNDLEEAAETFCDTLEGKEAWSYGPDHYDWGDVNNAFIAGAEWQKSQMVPNEDVFKIWGTTEKEYLAKSMDKVHLEMEIATYLKDWEDDEEIGLHLSTDNGCIPIELEDVRDLARHFAQWGAEHLKK